MKLRDYLYFENIKQKEFIALAGMSISSLQRILKGTAIPTIEMALRIRAITDGKVSFDDLGVELPPGVRIESDK